jgi:hypothetical protein
VAPQNLVRARLLLWLPKTPNAPESLEFLDSLTQYRRHAKSSSDRSSLLLPADSAAGRLWSWRTSRSVISCAFFAASSLVGPGCLLSTACSGSFFTDCGPAVWSRWCWSSQQRSFSGTVKDCCPTADRPESRRGAKTTYPDEAFFSRRVTEGHRLDSRQRESSINQMLAAESKLLRCPRL